MNEEPAPLSEQEFTRLWESKDFREIVHDAATGADPLRFRRIVVEARLAKAQDDMVRWTRCAVLTAIGTSLLGSVVSIVIALTKR